MAIHQVQNSQKTPFYGLFSFRRNLERADMSLISKILLAFAVLVAIAVASATLGWFAVNDIDETMNDIIEHELVVQNKFNELETTFHAVTVAQRTLLNLNLPWRHVSTSTPTW